ncbi:MAG: hypothetical protein VB050_14545 [Geobacteraceae bacterium]|nr:hypothetical protein [Geobacteraceae bacterium]
MSLTTEAYREREWEDFPALRKILEDKPASASSSGTASASDNFLVDLVRLTEIAELVNRYQAEIEEKAISAGREEMYEDLKRLEGFFLHASRLFERTAEDIARLCRII